MTGKTDEQLAEMCKEGDDAAFTALLDRHLKTIFNYTLRIIRDPEAAEDCAQETFLKTWKKIGQFRKNENFKSWLFAIAHNTAFDYLRKKKALIFSEIASEDSDTQFENTIHDETSLPEELYAKLEDVNYLETLLAELKTDEREILLLHYAEDMTFAEIGKIQDKPLHTVKSQHRRAMLKLRDLAGNAPK